jgi:large repetitive protein
MAHDAFPVASCFAIFFVASRARLIGLPSIMSPSLCFINDRFATSRAITAYFTALRFALGTSSDIANNHLPIAPILTGSLRGTKTMLQTLVTRGGLVAYNIGVISTEAYNIPDVEVIDRLPAGFANSVRTAQIDSVNIQPGVRAGRELV